MKTRNKHTVVSLFSGCGGLDIGFKSAGFDLKYACDNDPYAVSVYQRNVCDNAYLRDVSSIEFHNDVANLGSCDVVLGGFPCQGFSKAGPKKSEDSRNLLYLEMKAAVEKLQPQVFIAENVDGLSQNFKGMFLEQINKEFSRVGYDVDVKILDAVNFGLPQYRRRIFFVGVRKDLVSKKFRWPSQTHSSIDRNGESTLVRTPDLLDGTNYSYVREAVTIRESIFDIRKLSKSLPDHKVTNKWGRETERIARNIDEGQKLCNVRFSDTSVYTWQIPEVFGDVDEKDIHILETIGKNRRHKKYGSIPNGNPLSESTIRELASLRSVRSKLSKLVKKGYLQEKNGGYDLKGAMFCSGIYKRPMWDQPSPTILTMFHNPRYFLHPERNTPFSLRECARLQGFSDDFLFTKSDDVKELENCYRLVGNAVPPPLANAFANSVKNYIEVEDIEITTQRINTRVEDSRV